MNIGDIVDLILNIIAAVLIIWTALKLLADVLIRYAKKYRWAIGIYTILVAINPFDATAFLNRSWAYLEVKKIKSYSKCRTCYRHQCENIQSCVQLQPRYGLQQSGCWIHGSQ